MVWVFFGLVISAAIGYAGYVKGALSRSGAAGAIVVGTIIFGLGGWDWGVLLVAFFLSSSLLSHYRRADKAALADKFAKGSQRDAGQTLANGGLGMLLAVGSVIHPHSLWLAAYVGAMAAVNADTWATEIGVLSQARPRLITTGRVVEVGASGGVSWLGTAYTVLGGAFIGLLAGLLRWAASGADEQVLILFVGGLLGGLAGSLFDSLLGATVQAIYFCDRCVKETERAIHRCRTHTSHLRGWRWLGNDLVNLIASAVGAVVASLMAVWLN